MTDSLSAFEPDAIASVVGSTEFSESHIRDLLREHQELMQETPGVDNLLFEWRKRHPWDIVVEQSDDAYYVVVGERIWHEYSDSLGYTDRELEVVRAVHSEQIKRVSGFEDDDWASIVLSRA